MARNSGPPARDLFPGHSVGAGKGSKTRTNLASPRWLQHYDEIAWPRSAEGFQRDNRGRLVKKYKLL